MSVKYIRSADGKFRGSIPTVPPIVPSPHPGIDSANQPATSEPPTDHVVDAWAAFERSKQCSSSAEPLALAQQALADYRRRAEDACSQDDLYDAQNIYHEEIASIPLGPLQTPLDSAWNEYRVLHREAVGEDAVGRPETEPHGWIYAVASRSEEPRALEQVWAAADEISRTADDMDPRLDTAEHVRLELLEFNAHTPPRVFAQAYAPERLDSMMSDAEGDYVEHLVRAPWHHPSMPQEMRDVVFARLGEWAESSDDAAQDIDDAITDYAIGSSHSNLGEGVSRQVLARFVNSPSQALRYVASQ